MFNATSRFLIVLVITLLTSLLISACSDEDIKPGKQMPPSVVKLSKPRLGPLAETISIAGSLAASQQALLSSESEGLIRNIYVQGGQSVANGALVMQLSNDTARAELKRASADVTLRREEAERAKSLLKRNVNSQYDVDKSLAQLDTAEANKEIVEAELEKRQISAPFAGQLGIRKVNVGSYVEKGQALIELVSLNPLFVDFKIPETAIASIKPGDNLSVTVPAMGAQIYQAKVKAISPSVETSTRTLAVRASINNADLSLKPGLFAKIQLPLKLQKQVMWLPEVALFQQGDASMIMLNEAGKARRVKVDVLSYQGGEIAIAEGEAISTDAVIVSEGHHKVPFDGMAVMTVEQLSAVGSEAESSSDKDKVSVEAAIQASSSDVSHKTDDITTDEQGANHTPAEQ